MVSEIRNFELWKYVLTISQSIEEDLKTGKVGRADLLTYLESIKEIFGKTIDPTEDFQGVVLVELCRSLSRSIESLQKNS